MQLHDDIEGEVDDKVGDQHEEKHRGELRADEDKSAKRDVKDEEDPDIDEPGQISYKAAAR
jgi:hypothetical protein